MPKGVHLHIFAPNERQKRVNHEKNQNKLTNFSYRCTKELTRGLKLVKGLREQRASKLVKNIKKEGPEKVTAIEVLAAIKTMPVLLLVRVVLVESLSLKDEAAGIELAKRNTSGTTVSTTVTTPTPTTASTTTTARQTTTTTPPLLSPPPPPTVRPQRQIRNIILEPLTKRQRGMVQKWINDTRVKSIVESLRKIRGELKSKVRHMRDRLGRKEKREAIKLDPSLKPKKIPKPVPAGLSVQSDLYKQMLQDEGIEGEDGMRADYYVPAAKKKKNRLGQRARKKLAEEAEAAKQRGANRSQRRSAATGEVATGGGNGGNGKIVMHENRKQKREKRLRESQQSTSATNATFASSSAFVAAATSSNGEEESRKKPRYSSSSGTLLKGVMPDPSTHPSWQARSLAKEKQQNAKFVGSKVTFNDSDDEE